MRAAREIRVHLVGFHEGIVAVAARLVEFEREFPRVHSAQTSA
jgi:hypothetical protein